MDRGMNVRIMLTRKTCTGRAFPSFCFSPSNAVEMHLALERHSQIL